MPMPPYSSGTGPPRKPSGAIFFRISVGKIWPRSRSRAPGAISLSAKSFASLRIWSCSGVRSKSMTASVSAGPALRSGPSAPFHPVSAAYQLRSEGLLELTQRVAVRLLVERGDTGLHHLDRVAEVARIRRRVEDADVRAVADESQRVDPLLAQRDVEVGAEEARVAALRDDDIGLARRELRYDLGALRADDGVRREHLELGVVGHVRVGEVHDRLARRPRALELALDDRDDPRHRRAAVERAALVREVVDHVDDDERALHRARAGFAARKPISSSRAICSFCHAMSIGSPKRSG